MDPSIFKLLEEDEDESMHSGADVDAFQAALNRDIEGSLTTSLPLVTNPGNNHSPNQQFATWKNGIRDANINVQTQHSLESTQMKEQQGSALENQHQHDLKSANESHLQHNQSQDLHRSGQLWENPSQAPQTTGLQISEKNPTGNESERSHNQESESQYSKLQKMSSQQARGVEQSGKELEKERKRGNRRALELAREEALVAKKKVAKLQRELKEEKIRSEASEFEIERTQEKVATIRSERDLAKQKVVDLRTQISGAKTKIEEENERIKRRWADAESQCATRLKKLKEHFDGRARADPSKLLLSQATGTIQCLGVLEQADGLKIPPARYQQLQEKETQYKTELATIDYLDLSDDDFEIDLGPCPALPLPEHVVPSPLSVQEST